jgi:hypothetical protein
VRDGEWLKMEVVWVVKMAFGEMDHFGIIYDHDVRITSS